MHPAHPLCIHSNPQSILSASCTIFNFGCQNPHPCSFFRSPCPPLKPLHMWHPICTPHIPRVYIPTLDQYRVRCTRYSILGVKTPAPARSLDPRVRLLSHFICGIPYAPCTSPMYTFRPPINVECIALNIRFWVSTPPRLFSSEIPASASQATSYVASHMHPAHPPCIHSNPRSILSAMHSIFDFGCQNPHPC